MIVLFAAGGLCVVCQTHFGTTQRSKLITCTMKTRGIAGFSFRPFPVCNGSVCASITSDLLKFPSALLVSPIPLSPARGPPQPAARKPDSGKGCTDGEKLFIPRWFGAIRETMIWA